MKLLKEVYTDYQIVFATDTGYFPYTATVTATVSPTAKLPAIILPPDKGANHLAGVICAVTFACLFNLFLIIYYIQVWRVGRMEKKKARQNIAGPSL